MKEMNLEHFVSFIQHQDPDKLEGHHALADPAFELAMRANDDLLRNVRPPTHALDVTVCLLSCLRPTHCPCAKRNIGEHRGRSNSEALVAKLVMLVNLPIRCRTSRFCTTSSRVGTTHNACGCCSVGSTRLSIASTKQVVFPLPLCACRYH